MFFSTTGCSPLCDFARTLQAIAGHRILVVDDNRDDADSSSA